MNWFDFWIRSIWFVRFDSFDSFILHNLSRVSQQSTVNSVQDERISDFWWFRRCLYSSLWASYYYQQPARRLYTSVMYNWNHRLSSSTLKLRLLLWCSYHYDYPYHSSQCFDSYLCCCSRSQAPTTSPMPGLRLAAAVSEGTPLRVEPKTDTRSKWKKEKLTFHPRWEVNTSDSKKWRKWENRWSKPLNQEPTDYPSLISLFVPNARM